MRYACRAEIKVGFISIINRNARRGAARGFALLPPPSPPPPPLLLLLLLLLLRR